VPATPLENPDLVKSRIDTIRAGGGTALFAGVSKGADELRKFISDNKVNRIILLSDGLANVGPSSPAELGDLGGSLIREGISVSTIGLGLDFNEDLMTQLAGRSDGFHQFAERPESLTQFFDWEFGNAASTVANNVDIDVQFSSGVRPLRVLGRESQAEIYANKVSARLNQIFSSHEIYLLVEAEVSPDFNGSSVASTTVTFHDLSRKQHGQQVVDTPVTLTRDKGLADRTRDRDVMVAAAEQKAALSQQEAIRLRDEGKVSEAKSKLEEMSDTLRDAGSLFQSQKLYEYADTLRKEWQNMSNDAEWNKNRKDTAERLNKGRFNVQ
jgi:Ca-activated chloride channel family protein